MRRPWGVEDGLWERIAPLLPQVKRNSKRPGRPRLDNRKVLCGILFVLHTGIRWEFLPQELGITPVIARRGTEHGSGLGVYRWVAEAAFASPHWFGRLRIRWEIRDDIHEAFLTLGCAIICWRRLRDTHLVGSPRDSL